MSRTLFARVAVASAALAFAAAPAFAVTVQNNFDKPVEITADHGDQEPKTTIDPGKSVRIDCQGCELRAPAFSYGVSAAKGDKLVIDSRGMLTYGDDASGKKSGAAAN
ncbi:MAG: hypothetical protein ABW275_04830 [Hansschlegelia sp.]